VRGAIGEARPIAFGFLDFSRISLAAACVGVAQRAFDLSCDFADARHTFGRPISSRQAVQMMITEMQTAIEASRQLVRHAAQVLDRGDRATAAAAEAKLHAMTTVTDVTDLALRVHGGIGYTQRHAIERLYRDARSFWFEEGTREALALVVARECLAQRRASRGAQGSA
jgi:alkylation response protein AidB-like acyl-CoA dehydrogenase